MMIETVVCNNELLLDESLGIPFIVPTVLPRIFVALLDSIRSGSLRSNFSSAALPFQWMVWLKTAGTGPHRLILISRTVLQFPDHHAMNLADTAGNRAAQADEIEALKSIYGDDFRHHDNNSCELLVRPVDGGDFLAPVRLCVHFPDSYPSTSEPVLEIKASWLDFQLIDKITAELHRIFVENIGNVILFAWIEWLKEQPWVWEEVRNQTAYNNDSGSTKLDEHAKEPQSGSSSGGYISRSKGKNSTTSGSDYKNVEDIDANITDELDKILGIIHGAPFTEKKSTFQAHLASVSSADDVENVMEALLQNRKIAGATHNIMAYRINIPEKGTVLQDYDDDGETAAGGRLLHLLQIVDANNVVVVVSRWFGGVLLGPDRFKHINNAARSLLNTCGFIKGSGPSASVNIDKQKIISKVAANKGRKR